MKVHVEKIMDEIEIIMPEELQSNDFSEEYCKIRDACENNRFSEIGVYFNRTQWLDNLAIIQLLLYLYKMQSMGKSISFHFNGEEENVECVRFIKYLDDYGYLDIMEKLSDTFVRENLLKKYRMDENEMKLKQGDFECSDCIMKFEILCSTEDIHIYLERLKKDLYEKLCTEIEQFDIECLIFKLSLFLQETLGNVFEHAYSIDDSGFCGVMIRHIHKSRSNKVEEKERNYFTLAENEEALLPFRGEIFRYSQHEQIASKKFNPYRNDIGRHILEDYMQVFVVDIGKGLLESMKLNNPKAERRIINQVFEKGKAKRLKKNTVVGGLAMLYEILQEESNYISVKGEYNWLSMACSRKKDTKDTLPYVYADGINKKNPLKGFSIVGYIDFSDVEGYEFFQDVSHEEIYSIYQSEYEIDIIDEKQDIDILDFRDEFPKIEISNSKILCFAGFNIDKAIWTDKILSAFDKMKKEKVLIIVDIPIWEIRKYELIFSKSKVLIDKIILLSENMKTAVLVQKGKRMQFCKKSTQEYKSRKEGDISNSLYELLKIIRKYDSCKFWRAVAEEQKRRNATFVINNDIDWDKGKKLSGYLDFSQACFSEKLRYILLQQLYRIPCSARSKKYISMDRFTEDLCENANSKQRTRLDRMNTSRMEIGSVYVTGTSSRISKLKNETCRENEYYFFVHPVGKANVEPVENALLLWPSKALMQKLFPAKQESKSRYKRLAQSPFISEKGTEYFTQKHYQNISSSICIGTRELYLQFQKEKVWTRRLVKFSHLDMVGYHDFIHLSAVALFNKHYLESIHNHKYIEKNSFDYLFKHMYKALGQSDSDRAVQVDVKEKYRSVISSKMRGVEIPKDNGLFIYLTDYETIEIVSRLESIFTEHMQERIIPIAPVNRKRGKAALLLSPVLMDTIKKKLDDIKKENGNARVTIFIATVISTQLQRELKHIMYRLGAKEIKCLSIIDRQRFPLGSRNKDTYRSFCKIDLPSLPPQRACKMCRGINELKKVAEIIISEELRKRCAEIEMIWEPCKASNIMYEAGIDVRDIKLPQEIQKYVAKICSSYGKLATGLHLSTDVGLVLFAVEYMAITTSTDFLEKCIQYEGNDEEKISDSSKMLLIASYLLLFEEEIALKDRVYLVEQLYDFLYKQEQASEYTALGVLVVLLQEETVKKKLYEYYKTQYYWERFENVDFMICSLSLVNSQNKKTANPTLKYWLRNGMEENINYLYGIFTLTDGKIENRHGTILSKMQEPGDEPFRKMDYLSAENDTLFLEEAYKNLPHTFFIETENCDKTRQEIIRSLQDVRSSLNKISKEGFEIEENSLLKERIKIFFNLTKDFNKAIFLTTDAAGADGLRKKLQDIIPKEEEGEIKWCYVRYIKHTENEKNFCYFEELQREIEYLIADFRYADSNDFFEVLEQKYHGIIEVEFKEKEVEYRFLNHPCQEFDFEKLKEKKKLKYNRPTILGMRRVFNNENIEDMLQYEYDKTENLYTAKIITPYING